MGFLNKAFKRVKKQIQPGNMIARDMGPGNIPRRGKIPARSGFLRGQYFGPRGSGFGFGLGETIRRQRGGNLGSDFRAPRMPRMEGSTDMGMPRINFGDQIGYTRPNKNPSMPGMIAGGTPGFYDNMRENMSPGQRLGQMPQPIPEQMPTDPSSYFNPTIFGQSIPQGADFGNMPDFSQIDMSQLDLSGIPQSISQMNLPQMPESLPSMEEIEGGRNLQQDFPTQLRQMMNYGGEMKGYAEGDEVMMMQENEMMAPNGGEIENMLSGMDSGEQEAMGELEQAAPEMEMIDQLVNMVVQMIQQGAGEEEVISFLREQGLDDEDIGTVFQLVAEMAETEKVAAQNEIGADLEQLG